MKKPYLVFIIVDDGGFPYFEVGGNKKMIPFDNYLNIFNLAKEFQIRIPICFTMKYLDVNNVSGNGEPVPYAKELIDFLRQQKEYIEVGYHGLTHQYQDHSGEFYNLDINKPVSEEIQKEHIFKSFSIFKDIEMEFPYLFVPPFHAWEPEVTDKILSGYGVRYLVSISHFRYNNHFYHWNISRYLTFLPRGELGIYTYHYHLDRNNLKIAKRRILPGIWQKLFHKREPVHSYVLHISNFFPETLEFWKELFGWVKKHPDLYLAQDNEEAVRVYQSAKQ